MKRLAIAIVWMLAFGTFLVPYSSAFALGSCEEILEEEGISKIELVTSTRKIGPYILEYFRPSEMDPYCSDDTICSTSGDCGGGKMEIRIYDSKRKLLTQITSPDESGRIGFLKTIKHRDGEIQFLIFEEWSGGAHCCFRYFIAEMGEQAVPSVVTIETEHSDVKFIDADNNPSTLELRLHDSNFAYWRASYAVSPAPMVIMRVQNGRAWADPELMRGPPLAKDEFEKRAREVRGSESWKRDGEGPGSSLWEEVYGESYIPEGLNSQLWAVMLDLIYSGNMDQAYEFFELGWPKDFPGKDKFIADFKCQLGQSNYWPAVAKLNNVPANEPSFCLAYPEGTIENMQTDCPEGTIENMQIGECE